MASTAIFAIPAFGPVSPIPLLPVVLVAVLLSLAAVRRNPLLGLAAIGVGVFSGFVGPVISLVRAF